MNCLNLVPDTLLSLDNSYYGIQLLFIGRFVDTEGGPQWIRALRLYHSGFIQGFTLNFLRKSELGALGWPGWNYLQGPGLGIVLWG